MLNHQPFIIGYAIFDLYFAIGLTHLTRYAKMRIRMIINFLSIGKKRAVRTLGDYKQEILIKQGREQFKKLLEKGIRIPVVLL